MKIVFLASAILIASIAPQAAHAADTAYSALRIVGKQSGSESLNRVVEVRGRNGAPSPAVWKITLEEPRARGGIREVEVQRGQIITERTPIGKPLGTPMNFNQLNLDSEGAFTIATQEAQKAGVAFDHIDYVLKSGARNTAPIWDLQLYSGRRGAVASLQLAADSGAILHQEGLAIRGGRPYPRIDERPAPPVYDRRPDPGEEDRDYVERGPDYRRRYDDRRDEDSYPEDYREPGEPIRNLPSLFRRAEKHFERRGRQIKNFFTGE